jgi:pyrimidine operon attenuation protein/uracil phosphoribosyltransferase
MAESKTPILSHQKIVQKINRMAYQIYEDNYDQKQIIIAGIAKNGYTLAQLISQKLSKISPIEIKLVELIINKKNPINSKVELNLNSDEIKNKSIILVDDVQNSGKTMIYGLQHFLKAPILKLSIAVLVDRSHKRFPVQADYVGISLATTLKEHVEVNFEDAKNYSAYLC